MNNEKKITNRYKKALETKKRIFDCAVRLFSERGYHNVSVDDIIVESNSSKGAFYNHFASKNQIIMEGFKQIDLHYEEFVVSISNISGSVKKLQLFIDECFNLISKEVGIENIAIVYSTQIENLDENKYLLDNNRNLYKIIDNFIYEGQENNEIKKDFLSKDITIMLITIIRGVVYDWCLNKGKFELKNYGNKIIKIFLKNISEQ